MKKLLTLVLLLTAFGARAQTAPRVLVNGVPLDFSLTAAPELRGGVLMAPAAPLFARLGLATSYNAVGQLTTGSKPKPGNPADSYRFTYAVGNAAVVINGVSVAAATWKARRCRWR